MAAGDYRLRIWSVVGFPQDHVSIEYDYGPEDGNGNTPVFKRDLMLLTWDEYVALVSASELQAVASIKGKMKDEIKVRVPLLANALDM